MTSDPIPLIPTIDMGQELQASMSMAELLVLSHSLFRLEAKLDEIALLDETERTVFWALEATLEKHNPVILSEHYDFYLRQAKSYLTGSNEDV